MSSKLRTHIGTRESIERPGGLHSYIRTLVAGQKEIGLATGILDEISSHGTFNSQFAAYPDSLPSQDSVFHFHFAHSAKPFLQRNRSLLGTSPQIMHFHGPWGLEGRVQGNSKFRALAKTLYERGVYKKFEIFVTASDAFGRVLANSFGIPPSRIHTVHPGVDFRRFNIQATQQEARERLGLDPDAPIACCVRRLEPRMGIASAIEAIEGMPDHQLIIVGSGSLRTDLETMARSSTAANRIRFLGRVTDEDLPLVYRASDVSIVPTTELEGFGMIVLESMAAGTPVIATRVGGLLEALGPFADELSYDGSVDSLRRSIGSVLGDVNLPARVSTFAKTRDHSEMAREVESIIENYVGG